MNAFSRSWELFKITLSVVWKDKELIAYPILSAIFSGILLVMLFFPLVLSAILSKTHNVGFGVYQFIITLITYIGLAFIATFFSFCIVYTAKKRFENKNATFWESINYAFSKIHLVFYWSLLAATVNIILKAIEGNKEKGFVQFRNFISSILGVAWKIATLFAVQSMVYYELTPFKAIKKSVEALKKTWGESLIRYFGLNIIQRIFVAAGILVAIPLFIMSIFGGLFSIMISIIFIITYFVLLSSLFTVANSVFNTALFLYANKKAVPGGYSRQMLKDAFSA